MTASAPGGILITGGGTGGHVYPALALGEELVRRGRDVMFVGARRGLEATAVPAAGFAIELLPGRGFQRRLTPAAIVANVGALAGAIAAFARAWRIVGREQPCAVVGVGGYASLPCVVAARLRRVPAVVHEQNAAPGLANRIAVRLGARPAVGLPSTPLRRAVLVGNPTRAAVFSSAPQRDPERPLVLVFGGSLGAAVINEAAVGLADRWRNRSDVRIRHVAGRRNVEVCERALAARRRPGDALEYTVVAYEDHMAEWYARASLAVCRAGAITIAELAGAGLPAILVPLPGAPADHQTRNAHAVAEAGAAMVIASPECSTDRLATEIDALLGNPAQLAAMGAAARTLARPDAAARLADMAEEACA